MARTSRTPKIRLGELLVAAGLVSEDKVRTGLDEQRRNNLFLGEALVKLGFVSEEAIAQAIIQHFNLPFLSAGQFTVPPEVFNLFPERMYHEYQFIAVDKIERVIIIIAAGPINQDMMEELERVSECKICHYVSTWRDIYASISRNSKELGGDAQIELTGLGSMLLDNPMQTKPTINTGVSITQKIKKLESAPSSTSPGMSRPSMPRITNSPPTRTVAAANLSALLSPLAVSSKSTGAPQVSASTPPSPRLTAFLKVAPPGTSNSSLPAIREMPSPNMQSMRMSGGSSANLSAVFASQSAAILHGGNGSSAGMPAASKDPKDNPENRAGAQTSKRLSSFLQIRK